MVNTSVRLGVKLFLGLLLSVILLVGCDGNGNNLESATIASVQKTLETERYEWLTDGDESLLGSANIFDVRKAIYNISRIKGAEVDSYLIGLWNNDGFLYEKTDKRLINHPAVRLALAQSMVQKGAKDSEYTDYIKGHIQSEDVIVKSVAVEALRDVYSEDALLLLREMADSEDAKIAEVAISGIKHQTVFGGNQEFATSLWEELRSSDTKYQELIAEYDRAYDEYLRERERRIEEGFVPLKK